MNFKTVLLYSVVTLVALLSSAAQAKTLRFSGLDWTVRPTGVGGPGPNQWSPDNVYLDGSGYLHLKLTKRNGTWYCAETYTNKALGFGRYQFWIVGRIDSLDPNVVFGMFGYPTAGLGPDGTHEIDIEFARWGNPLNNPDNFTAWPNVLGLSVPTMAFPMTLTGTYSTHRYTWTPANVFFQSLHGHTNTDASQFASWLYKPADPVSYISQGAQPLHINLWNFRGLPPINGREVEIIVRKFTFTPM